MTSTLTQRHSMKSNHDATSTPLMKQQPPPLHSTSTSTNSLSLILGIILLITSIISASIYYTTRQSASSSASSSKPYPSHYRFDRFSVSTSYPFIHLHQNLTLHELSLYNGTDLTLPLYLSFHKHIFDVTQGAQFYAHGSAYSQFTGKDSTRAFLNGCFQDTNSYTYDIRNITEQQNKTLHHWLSFYMTHPTYRFVGYLNAPDFNDSVPLPNDDCKTNINNDDDQRDTQEQ